ncbi:hypothetical protein [Streptomyces pinistramenti]|uniref:hypothetical protein n=1 Tax=Streptomyces pinistramenti TaxID=2884812 RepID=UPI001D088739|nr:hypothetical protein [Streptomyces pinistramenti]MCB5907834.1 hypothetical protein [Streptomyces pinistramenti]
MTEQQREEASEDAVPTRIGQAIMLHRAGDREEARNRLHALWHETGPHGDAFHRCTLAHYLADTQDDPKDELDWDLRALEAAEGFLLTRRPEAGEGARDGGQVADGRGPCHPVIALRAFIPSLHLNLAADYVALDRPADARAQLLRARVWVDALTDGAYRRGFSAEIDHLEARIGDAPGRPS